MMEKGGFAVFGNPIQHSKSPIIHTLFAQQYAQQIEYRAVHVGLDDFVQATSRFFEAGGAGLNVTVPFKHEAFALAHRNSERSLRAGAVNVLTLADDGLIDGDNTDGIGLIRDLIANLGWTVQGLRVLLVGAGGAARGVLEPLLREQPRELLVVNRTAARAAALASEFADIGPLEGGAFDLIGARQFDLIINATSAGLSGAVPALPSSMLAENSRCYDMVYGAVPTPFLRWSADHAAGAVSDGLGMLVEQAAEAFYLWRQLRPETYSVISQLRAAMEVD
ncbi:MAG: shikimate dehydrogenase [Halioglobus sp.]